MSMLRFTLESTEGGQIGFWDVEDRLPQGLSLKPEEIRVLGHTNKAPPSEEDGALSDTKSDELQIASIECLVVSE